MKKFVVNTVDALMGLAFRMVFGLTMFLLAMLLFGLYVQYLFFDDD